ncbi:MAG: winged helix-turn-helix transcriptional regulator [Candidatus Aenigmarchaeota archaeon]|nr:winged helix-turn-helix transcriptional regulator [Candidatus Aenigmarchaeota archaeon]
MAVETRQIQDSILQALGKGSFTIEEISSNIGVHRTTVSKYLAIMEAGKLVEFRSIGKAKMFFLPNLLKKTTVKALEARK